MDDRMVERPKLKRPGLVHVPIPEDIDVRSVRLNAGSIGATQRNFADAIGVPVKTLRNWEQRRRRPTGPSRILLALIARDPWIVFDVFNDQHRTPAA
jgi:putative transcriptional regulator